MISYRKRRFHFSQSINKVKSLKMHSFLNEVSSHSNFVVMPWDDKREIVITQGGTSKACTKWELIQKQLDIKKPITNFPEFLNVIKSYNVIFDKNGKQIIPPWKCLNLQKYFANLDNNELRNFFGDNGILSTIRNLVLKLRELVPSLELLRAGLSGTVKLHQMQVASLLASAFMCIFPKGRTNFPSINFNMLFETNTGSVLGHNVEKIKCLINYFSRLHKKQPSGHISFHRLCIPDHKFPRWDKTNCELKSLDVRTNEKIEDQDGFVHVDFANKYVGGGVLGRGCVQEEIRFVICPELIAARLFTECLGDNEALLVVGAERFCKYSGYSNTFKYAGDYQDATPIDETGHRKSYLTVIDALCFHNYAEQFRESKMLRELKKAYVGFRPLRESKNPLPLATGNWGCGAFGGDPQLKSLLQIMASSQAGRNVLYLTFGDVALRNQLERLYEILRQNSVNVGMLYRILRLYHRERKNKQTLFEFVTEAVNEMKKGATISSLQFHVGSNDVPSQSLSLEEASDSVEKSLAETSGKDDAISHMDVDFDGLVSEGSLDEQPEISRESGSMEGKPTGIDTTVWFENEISHKKTNREETEVTRITSSPSMFSEDEVGSGPGQFGDSSEMGPDDKRGSTGFQGGKRLVQKKITDCFLRK